MRIARTVIFWFVTLVFLAVLALWVRSYWIADSLHWSDRHRDHTVCSSGGRLLFLTAEWPNARVEVPLQHSATERTPPIPWWDDLERFNRPQERWLVVRRVSGVYPYVDDVLTLRFFLPAWDVWWMSWWPLGLLFALVPMMGTWRCWNRRRRMRRGLCLECGYDLRASGETCPECGTMRVGGIRAEAVAAIAHGGRGV